jgi:hypothetical protein
LTFPIRVDRRFWPWLVVFGVLRRNAWVRLDEARLDARFGFFSLRFALADIERWELQGPYRWWMALGLRGTPGLPEITFGGSAHGGVAIFLARPIPRWWWIRNLREIYFTLDDLEAFAGELERRGIPGADVRRQPGQS